MPVVALSVFIVVTLSVGRGRAPLSGPRQLTHTWITALTVTCSLTGHPAGASMATWGLLVWEPGPLSHV